MGSVNYQAQRRTYKAWLSARSDILLKKRMRKFLWKSWCFASRVNFLAFLLTYAFLFASPYPPITYWAIKFLEFVNTLITNHLSSNLHVPNSLQNAIRILSWATCVKLMLLAEWELSFFIMCLIMSELKPPKLAFLRPAYGYQAQHNINHFRSTWVEDANDASIHTCYLKPVVSA